MSLDATNYFSKTDDSASVQTDQEGNSTESKNETLAEDDKPDPAAEKALEDIGLL